MNEKISVPRSRIPKLTATCPRCGGPTGTLMSQAFADGYHRRHRCKNIHCDFKFYTLTSYYGGKAQVASLPFPDRELTEAEKLSLIHI